MERKNIKVYTQNFKIHIKGRFSKHFNVKRSYDTREWTRIEKGMKRNKNKHEARITEGLGNAVLLAVRPSHIQHQWRHCPPLPLIGLFMERKEGCPRETQPLGCVCPIYSPALRLELEGSSADYSFCTSPNVNLPYQPRVT